MFDFPRAAFDGLPVDAMDFVRCTRCVDKLQDQYGKLSRKVSNGNSGADELEH